MKRNSHKLLMIATLLCALFISSCQKESNVLPQDTGSRLPVDPIDNGIMIPMGGNAYITKPAAGGTETITAAGLTMWSNKNAIISTYFRVGRTGDLFIAFNASVPSGASSIKVTINGDNIIVPAVTGAAYKKYRVAILNVTTPGYIKVDFQGISNTNNSTFADVSDLIVYGTATTSDLTFANDAAHYTDSRKGAAVSLQYNTGANTEWFYNELTVPIGTDKIGTDFVSNGFNNGKSGMEITTAAQKRMTFFVSNSITDDAKLISKGANTVDGASAEGKSLYIAYNWTAGTTYKFLTHAKPDGFGNTVYSSWFYAPEDNQWKFIASCSRTNTSNYLTGLYSSLQGLNTDNGYSPRTARYYNQWINTNGTWSEVTTATFKGDATASTQQRLDYGASTSSSAFYLKSSGFFSDNLSLNSSMSRLPTTNQPSVDLNNLPQ